MTKTDELRKAMAAKKTEIENLRDSGNLKDAAQLAEELKTLNQQFQVEKALEDSKFENFLKHKELVGGGIANESHRKFSNALRNNFRNSDSYLRESVSIKGGYLVPTELDAEILSKLENENVMRQICRVIQTEANHQVAVVSSPPSASWVSEGQAIDLTDEDFAQYTLKAHKLAAAINITNELLADSFYDITTHVIGEFAKALGAAEEQAFIVGDGNGQPTGILTTIAADTDCYIETVDSFITTEDLINLQYSVERQYRRNACWLTSDSTLATIRKLQTTEGHFLWEPSLTAEEPPRLLGAPVYSSPYVPSEGDKPVILYGDFSKYFIADRGTTTVKILSELNALSDITTILAIRRVDGLLVDKAAVRGLKISA